METDNLFVLTQKFLYHQTVIPLMGVILEGLIKKFSTFYGTYVVKSTTNTRTIRKQMGNMDKYSLVVTEFWMFNEMHCTRCYWTQSVIS